jgi:hypothetical protein
VVADPLADHVVDLRGDVLPPERFPDLAQVAEEAPECRPWLISA